MTNFLALNYGWIILAVVGIALVIYAATKIKVPEPVIPTTKSADFKNDSVVSNPVLPNNQWANVFRDAATAAITKGTNPWIYLQANWEKAKKMKTVELALLDFITNEANQQIPASSSVTLSIRDYSNENSIVMEYRDPATDSILVATGHDPEPALYGTYTGKNGESKTFKLVCANGVVRELGGKTTTFNQDYVIKPGDTFIGITGSTPKQASLFAKENDLPVRFVVEGKINSKTPNTSRVKVFKNYENFKTGKYDVILQPGDILRKEDGKWLYIRVI